MICKVCGAYNEDFLENCSICASPLEQETKKTEPEKQSESDDPNSYGSWGFVRAPKWPKPEFNASTVSEDDIPPIDQEKAEASANSDSGRFRFASRSFDNNPTDDKTGYGDYDYTQAENEYARAPKRNTVYSMGDRDEDFDPAEPAPRVFSKCPQQREEKRYYQKDFDDRGGNMKTMLFWVVSGVLVVLIAVFGIIYINKNHGGSLSAFFSAVFAGNPVFKEPEIVPATSESTGEPGYNISIFARNGSTVRFAAGETLKDVPITQDNTVTLFIPQAIWVPLQPIEDSTVTVTPDIKIIDAEGKETPLELLPISINVPDIGITVTSPEMSSVTTDSSKIEIKGTVSDSSAAVFVNDVQFAVDASGNFSGSYELPGAGTHELKVEARKNGCRIGRAVLSVEYSKAAAAVGLAEGGELRGKTDTWTVNCVMEPGSSVSVTGDVTGTPVVDSAAGTFSFTANTPQAGQYSATVSVTKDGKTAAKTFLLERAPDFNAYVEGAHLMDYARIKEAPTHDQAYQCVGTIEEIIESDEMGNYLVKMDVGDGNILVMEYHGVYSTAGSLAVDNRTYTIYAEPNGIHEETGLPKMYAWFVLAN
jgi:hypothetical protein